jgi:hypothetical protein
MFQEKPIQNVVMQAPTKFVRNEPSRPTNPAVIQRARVAKQREKELTIANAIIAAEADATEAAQTFVQTTAESTPVSLPSVVYFTEGLSDVTQNIPKVDFPPSIPNPQNITLGEPYINPLGLSSSHREVCRKKQQAKMMRYKYMCALLFCLCCVGLGAGIGAFLGFRQARNDDEAHSTIPIQLTTHASNVSDT